MKKLFIVFAILCLAAPAMAADWNFYGSARMATFWVDQDFDTNTGAGDDDADLQWAQQGNSRIGANVKVNDQIGGGFEMSDSFGKRKLFATYTFGGGSQLLLGQTYTPSALFYSNSVYDGDGDLLGIGEFYEGRLPMIQWKMGGLKVALIKPNDGGALSDDNDDAVYRWYTTAGGDLDFQGTLAEAKELQEDLVDAGTVTAEEASTRFVLVPATGLVEFDNVNTVIPKIEVGYGFKADMFFADVFAGYQTYELESTKTSRTVDVDSYVLGGGVGANFGAFYAKAGVHFGQNLGNYGAYVPGPLGEDGQDITNSAKLNAAGSDVLDSDGMGYLAVIGFNASEMFTIEAGYGHEEAEVDESNNTVEGDQYYLNATINIAPGFFVVPEVGMITTQDEVSAPEPEVFYVGAKWQINF
jgi:hypothetical protein